MTAGRAAAAVQTRNLAYALEHAAASASFAGPLARPRQDARAVHLRLAGGTLRGGLQRRLPDEPPDRRLAAPDELPGFRDRHRRRGGVRLVVDGGGHLVGEELDARAEAGEQI